MSKTEVILTKTVPGLGAESDQVKVSHGYARNYLLPQGLAILLNSANKRQLEVLRKRRAEREAHDLQAMTELAQALSKLTLVVKVKTGEDGKMFGSVAPGAIADELKTQFDAVVEKRKIHVLHPIKHVGDHEVELRLHPQVTTNLKVRVESTTPVAKPSEGQITESRGHAKRERPAPEHEGKKEKPAAKAEKTEKGEKAERADKGEKKTRPAKKGEGEKKS